MERMSDQRWEGYRAYREHKTSEANPYNMWTQPNEFREWYWGWWDGREGYSYREIQYGADDEQSHADPRISAEMVPILGYNDPFNLRRITSGTIYFSMRDRIQQDAKED